MAYLFEFLTDFDDFFDGFIVFYRFNLLESCQIVKKQCRTRILENRAFLLKNQNLSKLKVLLLPHDYINVL